MSSYKHSYSEVSDLIELNDEIRRKTLERIGLSEEDVSRSVKLLLNWFEGQPLMGKAKLGEKHAENLFIRLRGSFESTKHALLSYYFLKSALPEYFANRDPNQPELRRSMEGVSFSVQFPVTSSGERYFCIKFKDNEEKIDMNNFYKLLFMEFDIRMQFDYVGDLIIIEDYRQIKKKHIQSIGVDTLRKFLYAFQIAYGFQIKACHTLCEDRFGKDFTQDLKSTFYKNTKITTHSDINSLSNSLDQKVLPKGLGGLDLDVDEIQDKWLSVVDQWRDWFLEEDKRYQAN